MDFWDLADISTPWCIHVVVTLRIANHIEAGVDTVPQLASVAGADPESLHRVLQHLAVKGLFLESEPARFQLTELGRSLLDAGTILGMDLDGFGGRMAYAWSTLLSAVRTGRPAYAERFGREFWDDIHSDPRLSEDFDALLGPPGHGHPDPSVLLDPSGWPGIRTVVDVGGGTGALLAGILQAHPHIHGTLVDLPSTVARSAALFQSTGVAGRVTAVAQSFFDPLPPGADLYTLKSVICDWPDADAVRVLRRCAEAARPSNGRVVVFTGEEASPSLLMLVLVGGKDRSLDEFRSLAAEAGLVVTAAGRQPSGRHHLVECRPA